jgi:ketosteroid isomerase-like protein
MGQANEELIRRGYALLNAGDMEGAKQLSHPEIELRTRFTGLAGRPFHGHEGVEQWFADVAETFDEVEQTVERCIDVDEERTISVVHFRGRGKGSGIEIDQEIASIWTIRDGLVTRVETHPTLEEALAATGRE